MLYLFKDVLNLAIILCDFLRRLQGTLQCSRNPLAYLPLLNLQHLVLLIPKQQAPPCLDLANLLFLLVILSDEPLPLQHFLPDCPLHALPPPSHAVPEPLLYDDDLPLVEIIEGDIFLFLQIGISPPVLFLDLLPGVGHEVVELGAVHLNYYYNVQTIPYNHFIISLKYVLKIFGEDTQRSAWGVY